MVLEATDSAILDCNRHNGAGYYKLRNNGYVILYFKVLDIMWALR
jgi:hypothetical protein